jgi:hypothetical protein
VAALESGGAQIVAACRPRGAPLTGRRASRLGSGAAQPSRPALAWLMFVEVFAAGPEALERRSDALAPLEDLRSEGYQLSPAIDRSRDNRRWLTGLIYRRIHSSGPERCRGWRRSAPTSRWPFIGQRTPALRPTGTGEAREGGRASLWAGQLGPVAYGQPDRWRDPKVVALLDPHRFLAFKRLALPDHQGKSTPRGPRRSPNGSAQREVQCVGD